MKRLLTLALIVATMQTAFARIGNSILNLRASDNSSIIVSLDGRAMARGNNAISIVDITPGRHYLTVTNTNRLGTSLVTLYNGTIDITPNTDAYYTVLMGMNKIRLDNMIAMNTAPVWQAPGRPIVPPAPVYPEQCEPAPVGPVAMSNFEFDQLRRTLSNTSLESTRMMILKQALPYNYFTTAQVRSLMNEFWFESSKLEVAKAAYGKTLDQYNYYLVNNEFSFGSSVRELGDYLAMN